jgi:hypothetical protein
MSPSDGTDLRAVCSGVPGGSGRKAEHAASAMNWTQTDGERDVRVAKEYGGQGRNCTALHVSNNPTPHRHPTKSKDDLPLSIARSRGLGDIRQFKLDLRNFARQFAQGYALRWERNPRRARELAIRYFRKYLPHGRPGRPRSSEVTEALELWHQGKTWSAIYAALIPDRDPDRRRAKQSRLRAAVRFRIRHPQKRISDRPHVGLVSLS